MTYSAAVIGTGVPPDDPDVEGMGAAYLHGPAYAKLESVDLVACADLRRERAEAFAANFGVPSDDAYERYEAMLDDHQPEIVSVCVPPTEHAPIVIDVARSSPVSAIHCEKPMARTWGEAKRMATTCIARDVQLTINHQRRFGAQWEAARDLLRGEVVGDLSRIETTAPNFFDWGTHVVDLCGYFAGDPPVTWVLGQVDYRTETEQFGVRHEDQALVQWEYDNGVSVTAATGEGVGTLDGGTCFHRLITTDGTIEVREPDPPLALRSQDGDPGAPSEIALRYRRGGDWTRVRVEYADRMLGALADVVAGLASGDEPALSARTALDATEVLFGAYESARRRGRVDMPLDTDDHPLESMVRSGQLSPRSDER